MKENLSLAVIFISCVFTVFGQSPQEEIQRLEKLAKANEQVAIRNAELARKAEAEVRIMRYMAIANEIAEYALEIQDKELTGLLAVHAFNFNERSGGRPFNNKIYNALVDALKKYDLIPKNVRGDSEEKYLLKNTKPTFSAAIPNGQYSVVAEQNGNLKFVDKQGMVVRILSGHHAQVDQIEFSHSGKLMATSGKDNTIRLWKLNQLNVRPLVITENDQISKLTFSPDDTYIFYALGVEKATIHLRPLDMKLMAADLCNVLVRNLTAEEWITYVATDLPYEQTCAQYPPNNK